MAGVTKEIASDFDGKCLADSHLQDAIAKWATLSGLATTRRRSEDASSMNCASNNSKNDDDVSPCPNSHTFHYVNDDVPRRLILQSRTATTQLRGSNRSLQSSTSTESSIRSLFALADDSNNGRNQVRRLIVIENGRPFLNPKAKYRSIWDVIVMAAVLYFTFFTPLRLALLTDPPGHKATSLAMSIIYAFNIAFTLMTGYEGVEGAVFSYRVIARQYIRSWLLIDLVTIFPYEKLFSSTQVPMHDSSIAMFFRWQVGGPAPAPYRHELVGPQNVAILSMACVSRMQEISNRLLWRLSHATFQFVKMIFLVMLGIHLSSCLWMYMAVHGNKNEGTWLNHQYRPNQALNLDVSGISWSELYVACSYFAITISSGVGYGDYFAITFLEKIFAIFAMTSSSSLIAFLVEIAILLSRTKQ